MKLTRAFLSPAMARLGVALAIIPIGIFAQDSSPCPRFPVGSVITAPEDLFSRDGVLRVQLSYQTTTDANGNTLYCFVNSDGAQSPTLHVYPGDRLIITLTNNVPAPVPSSAMPMLAMTMASAPSSTCGAMTMNAASVNIHYHGTNTPSTCHQDEVIHTLINSGETFEYDVEFPIDEPPGLYWYHPHVHGISEAAVQGGASGALIVEGIENVTPAVAGVPQHLLIIRDNPVPGSPTPGGNVPAWDISLNYVPIAYPAFTPAVIQMKPLEKQFWRVLNASADTIIDLQLQYDGVPQPLEVVALDGVPVGSQDGTSTGKPFAQTNILLGPAARAEFIVAGPAASVRNATLLTLNVDTGPDGDNDPERPIAVIKASESAPETALRIPHRLGPAPVERFAGLSREKPTAERRLYFSEVLLDPSDPASPTNFFITVEGQKPTLFSPDNPPAIVTTQGAVEDWIIQNRTMEAHDFHIHQVHFLLLEQNGEPVRNGQFLDTVEIPYWTGQGAYPSVKVRVDFRGVTPGDFVYHCHILEHEDGGMMATIRVRPAQTQRGR